MNLLESMDAQSGVVADNVDNLYDFIFWLSFSFSSSLLGRRSGLRSRTAVR